MCHAAAFNYFFPAKMILRFLIQSLLTIFLTLPSADLIDARGSPIVQDSAIADSLEYDSSSAPGDSLSPFPILDSLRPSDTIVQETDTIFQNDTAIEKKAGVAIDSSTIDHFQGAVAAYLSCSSRILLCQLLILLVKHLWQNRRKFSILE